MAGKTITKTELARLSFCNSKSLPNKVWYNGKFMQWVGIGWIEIDKAEAKGTEPTVVEDDYVPAEEQEKPKLKYPNLNININHKKKKKKKKGAPKPEYYGQAPCIGCGLPTANRSGRCMKCLRPNLLK
jgi:hypothetical protein